MFLRKPTVTHQYYQAETVLLNSYFQAPAPFRHVYAICFLFRGSINASKINGYPPQTLVPMPTATNELYLSPLSSSKKIRPVHLVKTHAKSLNVCPLPFTGPGYIAWVFARSYGRRKKIIVVAMNFIARARKSLSRNIKKNRGDMCDTSLCKPAQSWYSSLPAPRPAFLFE